MPNYETGRDFGKESGIYEPKDEFDEQRERQGIRWGSRGGGRMLRLLVKIILFHALVVAVVIGAHGLVVEWMSLKGLQSWYIPTAFVVVGLIIGSLDWRISSGFNVLRKLNLW